MIFSRSSLNKGKVLKGRHVPQTTEDRSSSQSHTPATHEQQSHGTVVPDQGNAPIHMRTLTFHLPLLLPQRDTSTTARQGDSSNGPVDGAAQAQNVTQSSNRLRNRQPAPSPSPSPSPQDSDESDHHAESMRSSEESSSSSEDSDSSDSSSVDPYGTIHTTGPEPFTANLGTSDPFALLNSGKPDLDFEQDRPRRRRRRDRD